MAPERGKLKRVQSIYTNKVDVWMAGVVLYECVCGKSPFLDEWTGNTDAEKQKKAKFTFGAPVWKTVSRLVKHLIRQMLVSEVKKRLSTEEVLEHSWSNDYDLQVKAHKLMAITPPMRKRTRVNAADSQVSKKCRKN